jgi:uncharacterized iron-regulated membrane protein
MTTLQRILDKPRSFAARGWLFQIHLWVGVLLALYAVLIGLTGSALVFYPQIRNWQDSDVLSVSDSGVRLNPDQIIASVNAFQPGVHIMSLRMPAEPLSTFRLSTGQMGRGKEIYVHPFTGRVLAVRVPRHDFLHWLQRLHFDLLADKTGRLVNASAGLLMVVLAITGIIIWWPGRSLWRRALKINTATKWKRLNYDIHNSLGFFSMAFAVLISLTGAYYGWPKETQELLSRVSPVRQKAPAPKIPTAKHESHPLPLTQLTAIAHSQFPHAWVSTISFPHQHGQPYRFTLLESGPRQYQWSNAVYLDPASGRVLRLDAVAGRSFGDAIIAWIPPLHFGSFAGGNYVATLWLLLGLTPAILGASGLLMWWNRVLVKKLWRWRATTHHPAEPFPVDAIRAQNR